MISITIDEPPTIPPQITHAPYLGSRARDSKALRLTPDQFGNVWRLVQDDRLAKILGYSMPKDAGTLECMGYRGDEIPAMRVHAFITLNRIELVEDVQDAPRYENGVLTTTGMFWLWVYMELKRRRQKNSWVIGWDFPRQSC